MANEKDSADGEQRLEIIIDADRMASMAIPAIHINRFYLVVMGSGGIRLAFGEADREGPVLYRTAVEMAALDAISLMEVLAAFVRKTGEGKIELGRVGAPIIEVQIQEPQPQSEKPGG